MKKNRNKKLLRKRKSSVKTTARIENETLLARVEELRSQGFDELEIQRILNK